MFEIIRIKKYLLFCIFILSFIIMILIIPSFIDNKIEKSVLNSTNVSLTELNVSHLAMFDTLNFVTSRELIKSNSVELFCEILAYLSVKYNGDFTLYNNHDLGNLHNQPLNNNNLKYLSSNINLYTYYKNYYLKIFGEFIGEYFITLPQENGTYIWEKSFGLKVFSPIAKSFSYFHYDDFGYNELSNAKNTGHFVYFPVLTPIINIETGIIKSMEYSSIDGWLIIIESIDSTRRYRYSYLNSNNPYDKSLYIGKLVSAGDILGYSGAIEASSYYSNINGHNFFTNIQVDIKIENEFIPVDIYEIIKFLEHNKTEVKLSHKSLDYFRLYDFIDATNLYQGH